MSRDVAHSSGARLTFCHPNPGTIEAPPCAFKREGVIMAMNTNIANDEVMAELNTTPLIDVLLVLLVLLLITLPIQTHAVKLDMPAGLPSHLHPVVNDISIDFDGTILWNGRVVDRAALDSYLIATARQNPQSEVHVTADRMSRYDTAAKVLSDAQRLGVRRLRIVNTGPD
jgi:biopolymer transport protein ExbD